MPRVLLLHTGGTLGMRGTPLEPDTYAAGLTETVPELLQIASLDIRIICNLDSSDIGPVHWTQLAQSIAQSRQDYDGFVVVHGTDTMSYTAGALAFALQNLDRPVVLTGAQRPLVAHRTDARRNLVDAVELATRPIPEVGICFDGLFMRGCRTTKSNVHDYRAFDSPGCQPLARLGVTIELGEHIRQPTLPFFCDARFEADVVVVHITPGLRPAMLEAMLGGYEQLRGVVFAAFGAGTTPAGAHSIAPLVRKLVDSGVEALVATQSTGLIDLSLYQNSRQLLDAGAISAGGMRLEAAVTKLMHALAIHPERNARRLYLEADVAGELA
ncbi:MAG: asparaginase [Bradymonadaceae bacterium]|nr:asparaginase [Lujinxingiaceae bacterium]